MSVYAGPTTLWLSRSLSNSLALRGLVQTGLVLAFDVRSKLSYPGTGTTVYDLSEGVNTGTLQNSPTYNTTYFTFDGVNDFVSSATSFTPAQSAIYTLSVWFRTSTASGRKLIGIEDSQTGTTAGNYDKMIYMGTNGKIHFAQYTNSFNTIQSTNTLNDNTWHNATAVYDGTNMILYIDGVSNGSLSVGTSAMNTSGWWRLASYKLNLWTNGGDGYYTGDIALAYVHHSALSAAEVLQNFNALKTRFGL